MASTNGDSDRGGKIHAPYTAAGSARNV